MTLIEATQDLMAALESLSTDITEATWKNHACDVALENAQAAVEREQRNGLASWFAQQLREAKFGTEDQRQGTDWMEDLLIEAHRRLRPAPAGWDKIEADDTVQVAGITCDRRLAQFARDSFWGSNAEGSAYLRKQFPNGCTLAEAIRFFHNVMPWKLVDATRPPAFNEAECGGAFDGRTVTSDADPGL